ncbi:MAG: hypothetical protein ABIO39_08125 [Caulobacteraceae bacterium]
MAVALFAAAPVRAVETIPRRGDPGLRDARVPASVPNISGVWQLGRYGLRIAPADGDPPWQPWAKKVFTDRAASEIAGKPMWDPTAACWGSGMPRLLTVGYPIEIIQTPDSIVFMYETQHVFRVVHMNAKHPAKIVPTFMGHAVGKWEGDTLVIDTIGLSGRQQIDERGTAMTEKMHLVERVRMVDDVTMEDIFTIDDPGAYTKPWTVRRTFTFAPKVRFLDYVCEENNRNGPDEHGVVGTRGVAGK